jgi:hypothetical protein
LGPNAVAAVDNAECEGTLQAYVKAGRSLSDAVDGFDGSDTAALEIENAAAAYRVPRCAS